MLNVPFLQKSNPGSLTSSSRVCPASYPLWSFPLQDLHEQVKMLEVLSQATCCTSYIPDLSDFTIQAAEEPKTLLMYALGEYETTDCVHVPIANNYSGTSFKKKVLSNKKILLILSRCTCCRVSFPPWRGLHAANNRCRHSYFDTFQFYFISSWRTVGVWYLVSLEIATYH